MEPGALVDGKYEILTLLGAGGMGEVYKARHIHLNAFRCVKVMKAFLMSDESYRQRFLREARLATQVHHPNVALVHDFSILGDGGSYMVTEFIEGSTVRQWSNAHGRFPVPLAAEVATQVLAGLEHIHRRGLLHRDISADNVMLSYDGEDRLLVKIIDLGVAKDIGAASDTTQAGMLIGNPKYMSPEQLGSLPDGEQLDGRADLYCFGVVLYEMLTGVPPFASKTPHGYLLKHLTEAPPAFSAANAELALPAGLEAVVLKALEKDRKKRYASAREFADALAPFLVTGTGTFTRTEMTGSKQEEATVVVSAATVSGPIDEDAFQATWEDGSSASWQRFLEAHPDSPRVAAAQELLNEAGAFEEAMAAGSTDAFRSFLRAWPEGRHRLDADIRLAGMRQKAADEAAAFASASAADTEEAWDAYLGAWRESPRAGEARLKRKEAKRRARHAADDAEYAIAREHDTIAAWNVYLTAHPAGLHRSEAWERVGELQRAVTEREPRDWETAWETGSSAAWDDYLGRHGESLRARDARHCREEAAEFEMATRINTPTMWRAFLKAWPEGRHRLDAEIRLRAVATK
ncbi:MAG TPA: serine/threonine-protein kinase [Thermoanaerobaculia bacterium]|jgi:serine/threonine-protein kinase|nr:serine/threonine-protein kinase [Thermoanaerobaculia bacterium]